LLIKQTSHTTNYSLAYQGKQSKSLDANTGHVHENIRTAKKDEINWPQRAQRRYAPFAFFAAKNRSFVLKDRSSSFYLLGR
jgi:hypothetical protein